MAGESSLWKWLRDLAPRGHFCRVETGDTDPGHPDVYYRINPTHSGFIELKSCLRNSRVPFPDEDSGLHRSQRIWIERELSFGGTIWILARVHNYILWIYGSHYDEFNGATTKELIALSSLHFNRNSETKPTDKISKLLRGKYGKV